MKSGRKRIRKSGKRDDKASEQTLKIGKIKVLFCLAPYFSNIKKLKLDWSDLKSFFPSVYYFFLVGALLHHIHICTYFRLLCLLMDLVSCRRKCSSSTCHRNFQTKCYLAPKSSGCKPQYSRLPRLFCYPLWLAVAFGSWNLVPGEVRFFDLLGHHHHHRVIHLWFCACFAFARL